MFCRNRVKFICGLFTCLFLLNSFLQAQTSSMSSPYSGSSMPSKSTLKPLEYKSHDHKQSQVPVQHPAPRVIPQKSLVIQTPAYFHPGMLVRMGNFWEGGDNLFNLGSHVGVFVEIIKPQEDTLPINNEQFQRLIADIFSGAGIIPTILAATDQPPLPFFQVQILLYPINKGYVASCEGRLFESVSLKRVLFDPGMIFQAITWQKKNLLVAPTNTIVSELERAVSDIAHSFIERARGQEHPRG